MKRRFIACFLSMALLLTMFAVPAAAEDDRVVISECDSLDGWVKTGGSPLALNVNGYHTTSAIASDVNNGAFRTCVYTLPQAVDVSGSQKIEWDMMFHKGGVPGMWEQIAEYYASELYLKVGSSAADYRVYRLANMTVTQQTDNKAWYHFSVNINEFTTETGTFDLTKMNLFVFSTTDNAPNANVSHGNVRFDNIYATGKQTAPPVEPTDDLLISDCDTAENGTYGFIHTGGNPFYIGTADLGWGTVSDTFTYRHVNYGAFRASSFVLQNKADLSGYQTLEWDMLFSPGGLWEAVKEAYGSNIFMKLYSSADESQKRVFDLSKLTVTPVQGTSWYHFSIHLEDYTTNAGFDPANFTRFVFVTTEGGVDTGVGNGVIGFDNIYACVAKDTPTPDDRTTWPVEGSADKEFTGSFSYVKDGFTLDVSRYTKEELYLTLRVYAENKTNPGDLSLLTSEGQLELTSSGQSDVQEANWSVDKLGLKPGWNNLRLKLSAADFDNGLDLSSVNFLRFYNKTAAGAADTYQIKIENVALTIEKEDAPLPSFFADGMMFQQNQPMNLWGKAAANAAVSVELKKGADTVETVSAASDETGAWNASLQPRAGGYDAYSITIKADGQELKTISDVLVGELWLSAGQSNMEYFVVQTLPDYDYSQIPLDSNVRFFDEPLVPGGVGAALPSSPAYDIEGAKWGSGGVMTDTKYISAIAYFTCLELRKQLDVPVGFINAAKGASVIEAWLSRDSIENNSIIKQTLQSRGLYQTEEQLAQISGNWNNLTALYNAKIAPLAGIRVAGVMWYQGESNVKYADANGDNVFYEEALKEIIRGWSGLFGFEAGAMPVIYANIAPYNYQNVRKDDFGTILPKLSEAMSNVWAAYPDSLTQLPIYDVSLQYKDPPANNFDPIHPSDKKSVAQRFAAAALSRVYHIGAQGYNAAVYQSMKIVGDKILVTMGQVGAGLGVLNGGAALEGFSVCGADRVFVNAQARIVSENTIEVFSPLVPHPVAAAYAFSSFNMNANLCNSFGLPAVPFRTDKTDSVYYDANDWASADHETVWVDSRSTNQAGFEPTWVVKSGEAAVSFDRDVKAQGASSLKIAGSAEVGPALHYATMTNRLSHYRYLSVLVKNGDTADKTLSLDIGAYTAMPVGVGAVQAPVLGSEFTKMTFDLYDMRDSQGGHATQAQCKEALEQGNLRFVLSGGTVYLDDVSFGTLDTAQDTVLKAAEQVTVSAFLQANGLAGDTGVYLHGVRLDATDFVGSGCAVASDTASVYVLVLGDVDGNGICNAADISAAKRHLLGKAFLTGYALEAAKMTEGADTVSVCDLVRMKRSAAGL